jgi:hypothetical protein
MNIKLYKGNWKPEYVGENLDQIFIFGDNNARVGKGGQAVIRGYPNTMGIRTKKGPSTKSAAYYKDSEYEENCKNILDDILDIKEEALNGSTIVLSRGGYGTGLASLKQKAPKTFEYLCQSLKDHFNFDNEGGKKWHKIPGHDDITGGVYVSLDKENKDILQPINNSYFRPEFLEKGLNTTFDLIKSEKKVAFTSSKEYKNDDVIIFTFKGKEHIVCRVTCSYTLDRVLKNYKWYSFEGFDKTFSIAGPEAVIGAKNEYKYQTHFQFICTLDDKGNMVFKNDIFGEKKKASFPKPGQVKDLSNEENVKVVHIKKENEEMSVSNEEILEVLKRIEDKLNEKSRKRFKNPFRRKTLKELLESNNIKVVSINTFKDDSIKMDGEETYEVLSDNGVYYYVTFKNGLFSNKYRIIFTSVGKISDNITLRN